MIKVGDIVTCVSLHDPREDAPATFLEVGKSYKVVEIRSLHGINYICIYVEQYRGSPIGHSILLPYHPAHFDIKYARKEKLKKLNKIQKNEKGT